MGRTRKFVAGGGGGGGGVWGGVAILAVNSSLVKNPKTDMR